MPIQKAKDDLSGRIDQLTSIQATNHKAQPVEVAFLQQLRIDTLAAVDTATSEAELDTIWQAFRATCGKPTPSSP